jgi:hypothetical protein
MKKKAIFCLVLILSLSIANSYYTAQSNENIKKAYYFLGQSTSSLNSLKIGQTIDLQETKQYKVKEGDSYWILWNLYGALRGMTFENFVLNNLNRQGYSVVLNNFNPFEASLSYKPSGTIMFESGSPEAQAAEKNNFGLISRLDNLNYEKNILSIGINNSVLEDINLNLDCIDIKILIINESLLFNSSLSLTSISSYFFEKSFGKGLNSQLSITIIPKRTIALSYLWSNYFNKEDFYDNIIKKGSVIARQKKIKDSVKEIIELFNIAEIKSFCNNEAEAS